MVKQISRQTEWSRVAEELQAENLKLASYDSTLLELLGDVSDKRILDYGCGPGVLATALQRGGANVSAYDISPDMRQLCRQKIGLEKVFDSVESIPKNEFDNTICNLVLCIVDEAEVRSISRNIRGSLASNGRAYTGFCNPLIYNVPESQLDLRPEPEHLYEENHTYMKTKKEGGYQIVEEHRPISWYEHAFTDSGLSIVQKHFTPKYELKGREIQDFIIFELMKK